MSTLVAQTPHGFTLVIGGEAELTPTLLDRLFEAGCDDATFGGRDGYVYGDFDRDAPTFAEAVSSAIEQVESTGLRVMRVEPEELVSASEIAARTQRSREGVRLLIEGKRGPGGFPSPLGWLDAKTRVWRWSDVRRWFVTQLNAQLGEAGDAALIAAVNSALEVRAQVPHLRGKEQRRAVAGLVRQDLKLLEAKHSERPRPTVAAATSAATATIPGIPRRTTDHPPARKTSTRRTPTDTGGRKITDS